MGDVNERWTAGGTGYGDISPRTAAFVVKDLLERGTPYLVFEKFGQAKPIPTNHSKAIKFRRYFLNSGTFSFGAGSEDIFNPSEYYAQDGSGEIFQLSGKELTEGTTPNPTQLESEDITATLKQYGRHNCRIKTVPYFLET